MEGLGLTAARLSWFGKRIVAEHVDVRLHCEKCVAPRKLFDLVSKGFVNLRLLSVRDAGKRRRDLASFSTPVVSKRCRDNIPPRLNVPE
jgi:hypothetical protein